MKLNELPIVLYKRSSIYRSSNGKMNFEFSNEFDQAIEIVRLLAKYSGN